MNKIFFDRKKELDVYCSISVKSSGKSFSINFINSDAFIFNASASLNTVVNCGSFNARSIVLMMDTEISFH